MRWIKGWFTEKEEWKFPLRGEFPSDGQRVLCLAVDNLGKSIVEPTNHPWYMTVGYFSYSMQSWTTDKPPPNKDFKVLLWMPIPECPSKYVLELYDEYTDWE